MRLSAHVLFVGLGFMVVAALWSRVGWQRFVPDLTALSASYLGLTARGRVAPSVAAAIAFGYLADIGSGGPPGGVAFAAGCVCLFAHLIQGRLIVRGNFLIPAFAAMAVVVSSLASAGLHWAADFAQSPWLEQLYQTACAAAATALVGRPCFHLFRLVDAAFATTLRERDAALEGR